MRRTLAALGVTCALGCGAKANPPTATPCDQACQDGVALKALRWSMAQAFNLSIGGEPYGEQDVTFQCPNGGTVHIRGVAVSDPLQGVTKATLVYDVVACAPTPPQETQPDANWSLSFTGSVSEDGTISSARGVNAIVIRSDAMTFSGTVYDPPVPYDATCELDVVQNANNVSGRMCGRIAWTTP